MDLKKVLELAKAKVIPTKEEEEEINLVSQEVVNKITKSISYLKEDADIIVGGSVGKGTWLPALHDIDFFLRFDYSYRKERSLSDIAEKIIKRAFGNYLRLHGSRDYFQVKCGKYSCEIVPVLRISNPKQAENITDISPLHIGWVNSKINKNKKLATEIRLTKKFFKGIGVYGAESYIRGFSGHVCEILTINYGSFLNLIKAASKWGNSVFIDVESYYKNQKEAKTKMNASCLCSPLSLVDPIQPERNAAAALSLEKFRELVKQSKTFLKNPSLKFFEEKRTTLEDIQKLTKKKKAKALVLLVEPKNQNKDIAGCKILKKFQRILKEISIVGFKLISQGWYWDKEKAAILWFIVDRKKLPEKYRHWGPPLSASLERINSFKKKYGGRVRCLRGKLYVDLPRKVRTIEEFVKFFKPKLKGDKIIIIG